MSRWPGSLWFWAVLLGLAGCLCPRTGFAATPVVDVDAVLKQTQDLATKDHSRFLRQLALLNQKASQLTPDQLWHLRFSNAWEAMYQGDYAKSEALFQELIRRSGNADLVDSASALLLSQLGITRRYTDAFELANRLAARLPKVTDDTVRYSLLLNLSQSLGIAGQTDLAVRYAHMAMSATPAGKSPCYAVAALVEALYNGHRLKPDSPELLQAMTACPEAREPVYNTNLWLTRGELYLRAGQPRKTLALLDRIEPRLDTVGYAPFKLTAAVNRAHALAALGDGAAAMQVALAVVAKGQSGDLDAWLKDAYEVLYRIEKKQGHAAAALGYYEKFAALNKAYLDDVSARALAYETVQQHVLAQKLETEKLSRQNATLRMQQELNEKTVENSRLYLALLVMALAFAGLWLFRLKRSQLHFRRLSRLDGLTAILNRQHFMGEVERALRQLERQLGMACMLFVDLDHFKQINDTYGHAAGDEVLRHVVAAVRQQLRPVDLFGRLGGEEFGVLLLGCSREQGLAIAERVRQGVEAARVVSEGGALRVSVSVGLAFTGDDGYQLRGLCRAADTALYGAKRGGRNRVAATAAADEAPLDI